MANILDLFKDFAEENQLSWRLYSTEVMVIVFGDGYFILGLNEKSKQLMVSYGCDFPIEPKRRLRLVDAVNHANTKYDNIVFVYDKITKRLYCRNVIRLGKKKLLKQFSIAYKATFALYEIWEQFFPAIQRALIKRHMPIESVVMPIAPPALVVPKPSSDGYTIH